MAGSNQMAMQVFALLILSATTTTEVAQGLENHALQGESKGDEDTATEESAEDEGEEEEEEEEEDEDPEGGDKGISQGAGEKYSEVSEEVGAGEAEGAVDHFATRAHHEDADNFAYEDVNIDAGNDFCGRDNCYRLLGLRREADDNAIKIAHHNLLKKWHPGRAEGQTEQEATSMTQKIGRAFEVLSDKSRRRQYDTFLDRAEEERKKRQEVTENAADAEERVGHSKDGGRGTEAGKKSESAAASKGGEQEAEASSKKLRHPRGKKIQGLEYYLELGLILAILLCCIFWTGMCFLFRRNESVPPRLVQQAGVEMTQPLRVANQPRGWGVHPALTSKLDSPSL